jgi:hypothetical protein
MDVRRVHPEHFPLVTVRIVEAPAIHETVAGRFHRGLPAGGDGFVDDLIHFGAAFTGEREETFAVCAGIADLPLGEGS